ncbi:TPA: restriction endonuclease subunit S [Escherichia coli]|uniref:restriction endonuclease subunit S n=2 Tax=Escherichia coli TaxID=562 RepID=UPI0018C012B0|nr:restriction endonuclease subunit S [Escherichia coli]EIS3584144.1 restriction endonuclease subunit S [Escherichia coli]ELK4995567.1 restriction endonuclease subunit S [Escherichia coli]ELM8918119.1 restriction endonuclease subunit S [Escherichia coli]MCT6273534.1 restriction endonuclease subunit S [Escherichia coli]MCT6374766.1 restriction endonuclease subunit S [Escherichia coli]
MSWPMVKLGDVCTINPRLPKNANPEQEVTFLAMAAVSEKGEISSQETRILHETKKGFTYFERGDVLLAKITPCFENGKATLTNNLNTQIGFGSTEFHVLRAFPDLILPEFIFYLVWNERFRIAAAKEMTGSAGQKRVSTDYLKEYKFYLPSIFEQEKIVAALNKGYSIHRKRQQAIKLADDFLRAKFLEMFGDPIENPKGWNVKPLADQIVHANNGISRRRKEDTNEGDIVLRLQDVHYSGIAFDKELNRIKLVDKEKQIARVEHDDLLFIRVNGNPNYVGRTAVFKSYIEPVYHNDHLIRIKLDNEYQSDFLCYLINSPFSRKLIAQQIKTSAGQHTISQDGILKLMFYRPPIELQEKFINIKNKIESIFYRKDKHEDLFASISNKLIHSIK